MWKHALVLVISTVQTSNHQSSALLKWHIDLMLTHDFSEKALSGLKGHSKPIMCQKF